jgi:hypothetical protein
MKFLKQFENWNPVVNKEVVDFIEKNKQRLSHLYDKTLTEEENMQNLITLFTENPELMKDELDWNRIETLAPITGIKNMAPVMQNIGYVKDFRSF